MPFVEIHMLQNFAPSNLNRDDTNSPKDCTFGGVRRARVSSQCFKRAIRTSDAFEKAVQDRVGKRTKLVHESMVAHLVAAGREADDAKARVRVALEAVGFKWNDDQDRTSVLLYVSDQELKRWADAVDEHYDALAPADGGVQTDAKASAKQKKKAKKAALPKDVVKALTAAMSKNTTHSADVALFGRMVAELTKMNIDAACQVAHALSTHAVRTEMDFYTAVDDLQPHEDTGAGMMGIVEFNSACFYRFATVDLDQLTANLEGDAEAAHAAVLAFCKAAVTALPSGKQNGFAALNLPDWVRVELHDGGPRSLVNAFSKPVRPGRDEDLVSRSIASAEDYAGRIDGMLGVDGRKVWTASTDGADGRVSLPQLWSELEAALPEA